MGYAKGQASREAILESATAAVVAHGFGAATVEAICRRPGMTKGKLFFHFPSKVDLWRAVWDRAGRRFAETVLAPLADRRAAPADALRRSLEGARVFYLGHRGPRGCLMGLVAVDLTAVPAELVEGTREAFGEWEKRLQRTLRRAGVSPSIARERASLVVGAIQGGIIKARAFQDDDHLARTLKGLASMLSDLTRSDAPGSRASQW